MTRSLRLSWTALVGPLVLAALLLFTLTAAFVQVLRRDLDWMVATLSLYLHGPGGLALRVAYCVLALAIVLLALALYRQPPPALRRGLPLALFVVAAIGLCTVAIGDSYLPAAAPLLAPLVHAVSAQAAFLCVTCAMLLQAWRLRGIRRWRPYQRGFWYWAWLSFAALWLHVGWRASPRGLGQKWVIAMVLVWLSAAAWRLWRLPHAEAVLERGSSDNGSDIHPQESAS